MMDLEHRIEKAINLAIAKTRLQFAIEQAVCKWVVMQGIKAGIRQARVSAGVKSVALDHLDDLSDEEKAAVEWAATQMMMRRRYERGLLPGGKVAT